MIEGDFDSRTVANMTVALDRVFGQSQLESSISCGNGSLRPSCDAPRPAGLLSAL